MVQCKNGNILTGTQAPVILTSRSDTFETKLYSIALGAVVAEEMKKNKYNISDLMLQLRNKDIQSPKEVEFAILEGNGNLNIIKKENIIVNFPDPIIMDGKINKEVVKKINKTEEDILIMISKEGYQDFNEIFFCQLLKDGLYIVPFKK